MSDKYPVMSSYKAIQTSYNGYMMRSRLEARWAVFFDALGITWEYEKEGYELDGIRYLPDFWLPRHDCFIEIKGQEPTHEELEKARLLALYSGKQVHILWGTIGSPLDPPTYNVYGYGPPQIWTYPQDKRLGDDPTMRVIAPHMVYVLIQKLADYDIAIHVQHGRLQLRSHIDIGRVSIVADLQEHLDSLEDYREHLITLRPLLEQYGTELITALTPLYGWKIECLTQDASYGQAWHQCGVCGHTAISLIIDQDDPSGYQHKCGCSEQGICTLDTAGLIAAYKAARSARFEFGEKGASA